MLLVSGLLQPPGKNSPPGRHAADRYQALLDHGIDVMQCDIPSVRFSPGGDCDPTYRENLEEFAKTQFKTVTGSPSKPLSKDEFMMLHRHVLDRERTRQAIVLEQEMERIELADISAKAIANLQKEYDIREIEIAARERAAKNAAWLESRQQEESPDKEEVLQQRLKERRELINTLFNALSNGTGKVDLSRWIAFNRLADGVGQYLAQFDKPYLNSKDTTQYLKEIKNLLPRAIAQLTGKADPVALDTDMAIDGKISALERMILSQYIAYGSPQTLKVMVDSIETELGFQPKVAQAS